MATIKFKHNQEWRDLIIPLSILQGGGSSDNEDTAALESVKITGTDVRALLPNLSAYVSDLSQIAFMTWHDIKTTTNGKTKLIDITYYSYCSSVSDRIFSFTDRINVYPNSDSTVPPSTAYYIYDYSTQYKLGGSVSSIVGEPISNAETKQLYFVGNIHLYYKGE